MLMSQLDVIESRSNLIPSFTSSHQDPSVSMKIHFLNLLVNFFDEDFLFTRAMDLPFFCCLCRNHTNKLH